MYVHPNTFRYRLRRLAEVGDIDLADSEAAFVAMLQLRVLGTGLEMDRLKTRAPGGHLEVIRSQVVGDRIKSPVAPLGCWDWAPVGQQSSEHQP